MADISKQDVVDFIANMTVLELSEMVKELEEKFGVSAAAPVAMMAAGPAADGGGAAAEEQTEFDVILVAPGDKKDRCDQRGSRHYRTGAQRSQGPGR
jgi:large subunit ribosomal protein L7/L12